MNCPNRYRFIPTHFHLHGLPRVLLAIALGAASVCSGQITRPVVPIGSPDLKEWKGVAPAGGEAKLSLPGTATFEYPKGPKGWYDQGFRRLNDGSGDWRGSYGVQFEVKTKQELELEATITTPPAALRQEYLSHSKASLTVPGTGDWQSVTLPWSAFDFEKGHAGLLQFIQSLKLSFANAAGKAGGEAELRNIRLVQAPGISLSASVRGKAAQLGGTVTYDATVGNCTNSFQDVTLNFDKEGWEVMNAQVSPRHARLAPGATASIAVKVQLPEKGIQAGGHERQKLVATVSGQGDPKPASLLEFVTAVDLPRPSILHTVQGWEGIRQNVKKYSWAAEQQSEYLKAAEEWTVSLVATPEERQHGPEHHPYIFPNPEFGNVLKSAVAWQLSRNKAYAEKVALFLRRLSDEKTGYRSEYAGTSMGEPQEGGNWQNVAIAYDAILDAGVLSDADKVEIERTFRAYLETIEPMLNVGNVGNWCTAANTAGLFCSLSLGDLAAAERYLWGPSGFADYVTKGIMDDGWWWECSSSYNFWVAAELTQSALACKPWGIDLINRELPANFSPNTIITPWGLNPPYGINFEKWGPNHRNTRSVKQLWDAIPPAADYRGITFGMNDGHEEMVGGTRMEMAYFAFRDPAYLPLIKQSGKRDLIYGVGELPETIEKPYLKSHFAENLGYALLRSQTSNRPANEQIQAVFKIGTQGGFHGHFDRVSFDSLMRYGRSFWNPEAVWWGYPNFMYKFYVQSSVAHNMVVVDQKQQEAVPSSQLLFSSGSMMQVVVHESNARWSDPPYLGMQYDPETTVEGQMRRNSQSLPVVTDRKFGELGPFSDRVLQRRMGIVTDDYVVIADYLKARQPHTFDNLFQMKRFLGLEGQGKKFLRHDSQYNSDPHSAAQFVTDADWHEANAPVVASFQPQMAGEETDTQKMAHNEPGDLKLDVYSLWPRQQQLMVATAPAMLSCSQWVCWELQGDGKVLAKGQSGTWILGAVQIDVPVAGVKDLTLSITTQGGKKKALFLANARLVSADNREVPVEEPPKAENIAPTNASGKDYYGGPIKIEGALCSNAFPAQPADAQKPGVVHLSLAGKNATRFRAVLGGDYPFGDESATRKVYAIRSHGTEARFLTIIEPYEAKPMVKSATASGPDKVRVELADGRVQEIAIRNLEGSGNDIAVELTESRGGKVLRSESAR